MMQIPRWQQILFIVLLIASSIMGFALWKLRANAHARLLRGEDTAPTRAPEIAPAETATLYLANDEDGSLRGQQYSLPLPEDAGARAHAILTKLFELYATAGDAHYVPGGTNAVLQVYLMPVPASDVQQNGKVKSADSGAQLAVINLSAAFADNHPSGILTEMLTLHSVCSTLHANLPHITQVRFLVDGAVRPTLAGHLDLTRTYLTSDILPDAPQTSTKPQQPAKKTSPAQKPATPNKRKAQR